MTILDVINKKKKKQKLSKDEIVFFIDGMLDGSIADYQISALLMAIVLNGMDLEETINLTDAMINSGIVINLSSIDGVIVDKHSTGGVGDKVTLILAPLLASLGIKIAKMSGRGLGHTGGTIDKLESIPGYKVEMNQADFIKQVNDINISVISQSPELVPADKRLYALRDVTGTVDSIPLIASSIMSKKIASGADLIVIDVKVGNGALLNTLEEAKELAKTMVYIGKHYNKIVICELTDMSVPLGYAIGNSLEVKEAINTLQGIGPDDVMELIISTASMIVGAVKNVGIEEAEQLCFKQINNGEAYQKFVEWIKAQGGNLDKLEVSEHSVSVYSDKAGYISGINTMQLGEIARLLGAGRLKQTDKIDYKVGLVLNHKIGDYVDVNDELVKIYLGDKDVKLSAVLACFEISDTYPKKLPLVYDVIN